MTPNPPPSRAATSSGKATVPARFAALGMAAFVSLSAILSAHAVRAPRKPTLKPAAAKTPQPHPVAAAHPATGPQAAGEPIFRQRCALCHGAKGEGTKKYQKALAGSRSVADLATFIAKSMPPGA